MNLIYIVAGVCFKITKHGNSLVFGEIEVELIEIGFKSLRVNCGAFNLVPTDRVIVNTCCECDLISIGVVCDINAVIGIIRSIIFERR